MKDIVLNISMGVLALSILACLYRLLKGPTPSDRIAALDTIGILLLSMIAILGILLGSKDFIGIALVIGILTFIGTAALARYIERGAVIEPGDDEERR